MLEWIPYLLLGIILAFPVLQAGFWLRTRRLRGSPAPGFSDLLEVPAGGNGRLLFYFYSSHCGPCRTMTPRVSRLREEFDNVVMVDVNDHTELTCRFGISAVPSIVVVADGKIERALLGKHSERFLRTLLER